MSDMIQIHFYRPERTFGEGVRVLRRGWNDGKLHQLVLEHDGRTGWVPVPNDSTEFPPTVILDDDVLRALYGALRERFGEPQATADERLVNEIGGSREVAEENFGRAMAIVEHLVGMRAPDPLLAGPVGIPADPGVR